VAEGQAADFYEADGLPGRAFDLDEVAESDGLDDG